MCKTDYTLRNMQNIKGLRHLPFFLVFVLFFVSKIIGSISSTLSTNLNDKSFFAFSGTSINPFRSSLAG